ncbi:MAG: alpha/beta hydrolase, partial [Candidatus Eremiobacteraeota bacterium]|nr:alpha/beta hydrolase [Candidatus Eremiobacteraeota bacterium]
MKPVLRLFPQTIALCALVLSSSSVSLAQTANDSIYGGARPKPASVFTVGTLRVEKYAGGSPAMVFVPGLSCGSWVWDGAVKAYAGKHAVYVVTLAGFDGLPAPTGPALDGADASLLQLVTSAKLDRPIIVGHSLGGFLALRFGTEHAALVRGIVSVDGTPVFPTFVQSTPEQRATAADGIAASIRAETPDQYTAAQKQTLATMVTDPANVAKVAALSSKSDPKAVAAYASDLLRADLRPQLPKMTVPVLELAPVPTVAAPYEGPQAATASIADRSAGYKQFYTSLFPGAPNVSVVTIPNS